MATWHMVLLNSKVYHMICKNGQNGNSVAVIIVYTSITVLNISLSSLYIYNINHYPWEEDSGFLVQFEKF